MYLFDHIPDDDTALSHSPLLRAALLTLAFNKAGDTIELTPARAFRRHFSLSDGGQCNRTNFTAEELFKISRILNEQDFPPGGVLHDLLARAGLAKHDGLALRMTSLAEDLVTKPGEMWRVLTGHLIFALDESRYCTLEFQGRWNWRAYLDIIYLEATLGVSESALCAKIFGGEEFYYRREGYERGVELYLQALRPLCWSGLLCEKIMRLGHETSPLFVKTPLWTEALNFPRGRELCGTDHH